MLQKGEFWQAVIKPEFHICSLYHINHIINTFSFFIYSTSSNDNISVIFCKDQCWKNDGIHLLSHIFYSEKSSIICLNNKSVSSPLYIKWLLPPPLLQSCQMWLGNVPDSPTTGVPLVPKAVNCVCSTQNNHSIVLRGVVKLVRNQMPQWTGVISPQNQSSGPVRKLPWSLQQFDNFQREL